MARGGSWRWSSWRERANARLLITGAFASSDLERAIAPLLKHAKSVRAGYLSERDFNH
jgi:hypothetical protein